MAGASIEDLAGAAPFTSPNGSSDVLFESLKASSAFARPTRVRNASKMLRGSTVRARPRSMGKRSSIQGLGGGGLQIRTSTLDDPLDQLRPLQPGGGADSNGRRGSVPSLGGGGNSSLFTPLAGGGGSMKKSMRMKSMTMRGGNPFGRSRGPDIPDLDRMQSSGPRIIQARRPKQLFKKGHND